MRTKGLVSPIWVAVLIASPSAYVTYGLAAEAGASTKDVPRAEASPGDCPGVEAEPRPAPEQGSSVTPAKTLPPHPPTLQRTRFMQAPPKPTPPPPGLDPLLDEGKRHTQKANGSTGAEAPGEILVGHVAGYTGPVSKDATDMGAGARALFDAVNAAGGVLGRKLRLVALDDTYNAAESAKLIRSMAGKVSALLPMTGSRNLAEVVKSGALDTGFLPLVGAVPSQEAVRSILHKNVFHFRAGDRDQLEKMVEQLTTIGIDQIAILASTNAVGAEAASIVDGALQKHNSKLLLHAAYTLGSKDGLSKPVEQLAQKNPQAIIIHGPPDVIATLTKAVKARGIGAMLYAMSYADHKLISKVVGADEARGFVISQVLPSVANKSVPLVREFHEHFTKYGPTGAEPSFFNLEGYISARLIVEAIRRAKDSSPEGVMRGLEQMHGFDLGGYVVDFSSKKHNGSSWVDLSMIGKNSTLVY